MPDITRREVIQKIDEAVAAIQKYRTSSARTDVAYGAATERTELERRAKTLLAEARWVGSSGETCRRCSGSGVEPGT